MIDRVRTTRRSGAERRHIRVVVAADCPVFRAGLRAMLRAPDIRALGEAASVEELIRLVTRLGPGVVIIGLPFDDTDGLDLLRRLKDSAPKTSVVIETQSKNGSFLSQALALGCSGYLDKRMARPELLDAKARGVGPDPGRGKGGSPRPRRLKFQP